MLKGYRMTDDEDCITDEGVLVKIKPKILLLFTIIIIALALKIILL